MAKPSAGSERQRGSIDPFPSGTFRVRAYASVDPVTKRELYRREYVPAVAGAAKKAEAVPTRLLDEVDEKRNPRSPAPVGQLIDKYMDVVNVAPSTRRGYESKISIPCPAPARRASTHPPDAEVLDSYYAEIRRCRQHCEGKPRIQTSDLGCAPVRRTHQRAMLPPAGEGAAPVAVHASPTSAETGVVVITRAGARPVNAGLAPVRR